MRLATVSSIGRISPLSWRRVRRPLSPEQRNRSAGASCLIRGGKLLDESEIRATPTVLTVRGDTLDVLDYKLGGELGWII